MATQKKQQPGKEPGKNTLKGRYNWIFYILLINGLIAYFIIARKGDTKETTWKDVKQNVLWRGDIEKINIDNKETAQVFVKPDSLKLPRYASLGRAAKSKDRAQYSFSIGTVEAFEKNLAEAEANMPEQTKPAVTYSNKSGIWDGMLSWVLPVVMVIIFVFMLRRAGSPQGQGSIFDFGKARDAEYTKSQRSPVTFKDVAGYEEAKTEVREIVEFLKTPATFTRLGAKIPKGVLLVGPPGAGKTLLAKAVAGEAGVPFFSLSGSEFIEIFVGVGASRVRDLFNKAKQKAPCIIFIDEIDTVGKARGKTMSAQGNDERDSTLNQLLTEMDGFEANTGVIVMAATNRSDILDPALLRAGRFDRHIYLELPNRTERQAIFEVHLKPLKTKSDVDSVLLAAQTPGFSGADIANVCNEAALIAARNRKEAIDRQDFFDAVDRIVAGVEKKSRIISPGEKKIIAYHEAGHALVSWMLPHTDPLIKVSIIPRGRSLGSAWYLPEEHQITTLSQFTDRLCAALGGRVAEEIVFHEPTSGALDDLEKVTKQAYMMVAMLGLDGTVGTVSYYDSNGSYENSLQKPYSEATAQLIDKQVRKIIDTAHRETEDILLSHRDKLDGLANLLLEKEVVYKEDLERVFGKRAF